MITPYAWWQVILLIVVLAFCIIYVIAVCVGKWIKKKNNGNPLFTDDCMMSETYSPDNNDKNNGDIFC